MQNGKFILISMQLQEHWVAKGTGDEKGCVVLLEGDPPPTSSYRMSFQGFRTAPKTAYEKFQPTAPEAQGDKDVEDDAMAARWEILIFKMGGLELFLALISRILNGFW